MNGIGIRVPQSSIPQKKRQSITLTIICARWMAAAIVSQLTRVQISTTILGCPSNEFPFLPSWRHYRWLHEPSVVCSRMMINRQEWLRKKGLSMMI